MLEGETENIIRLVIENSFRHPRPVNHGDAWITATPFYKFIIVPGNRAVIEGMKEDY